MATNWFGPRRIDAVGRWMLALLLGLLILPAPISAQAPTSGAFPAAPYRQKQITYTISGARFTACVDGGGANGAPTNPLRTCQGTVTGNRIDLTISGAVTEKDFDEAMNVDVDFTIGDSTKYNRLSAARQKGPVTFPFQGGIDVPPDVTAVHIRIFLFESGVLHGVMVRADLNRDPVAAVTASYRLGYDQPINLMEDTPLEAMPLQLFFSSSDPAVPITSVQLDSQAIGNAAVGAALGDYFLFDHSLGHAGFPKRYDVDPPAVQVVWPLDTINLWALPTGALPLDVVFGARVDLANGTTVRLEVPVHVEAAYTISLLKAPDPPAPGQVLCETATLLDLQELPLRVARKGQPDQTLHIPAGAAVLMRFIDGSAGVVSLPVGDTCSIDVALGFSGRTYERPTNLTIVKIGLDGAQEQAKDHLQAVVLKLLLRGVAGPVGAVIDVVDKLGESQAGDRLLTLRLRSAAGITLNAEGTVWVQSFEGQPAIVQPDGQWLVLGPGEAAVRDRSGLFAGTALSAPANSAGWSGIDADVQVPVAPPPASIPAAAPTPSVVSPTAIPASAIATPPPSTPVPPAPGLLYSNENAGSVQNGPTNPTTFTLTRSTAITQIRTYHWNGGRGTPAPGTIGLRDARGQTYGPWPATGQPGQGNVPNAYWDVRPATTLPTGTYTVLDSDPGTWAYNAQSAGRGIAWIYGY